MGGLRNKKYRKYYLAIIFAVAFVLLSANPTNACILSKDPIGNCIQAGIGAIMALVFSIVGQLISVMAKGLYYVINIPVYPADGGLPVVDASWAIMRNFANMFFIIALIVMAFATIFNITKYEARTLFPKFLISALLINFSLVLGTLVIDASQILSNTFLTSIGDMSSQLGQSLVQNIDGAFPRGDSVEKLAGGGGVESAVFGTLTQLVFSVILFFTFLFSLMTAFLFALIRIPILWALLIVSPIAWVLNIFPAGQGTYKKWWKLFIGWNLFLPIFLFFLYFALYFLNNQGAVMAAIANQTKDQQIAGLNTFQTIFYYVMASVFLIGGTICAMKASMFSGTGVVSVAKWSRGVAARRLGITGAQIAAREKLEQVRGGEGTLGRVFGGSPPGLGAARNIFGVRGGELKTQKDFVDRAGKEFQTIQSQYDTGKITLDEVASRANSSAASTPQGFAYRKFAAKMGRLDPRSFETTLKGLANNPYAAQDFIKTAKEAKFATVPPDQIIKAAAGTDTYSNLGPNALPARRELYKHIQSDGKILSNNSFTAKEFDTGIQLLGGDTSAEGGAYLKDVGKVRPDLVANYHLDPAHPERQQKLAAARGGVLPSRDKLIEGSLTDTKEIAAMPKNVWDDPDFKVALERKLNFGSPEAQRKFRGRLYDNLRGAFNSDDKRAILDTMTGGRGPAGGTGGPGGIGGGGGTPPTGGGTPPPTGGPGPTLPPRTGRGSGNYPGGQVGFGPSAQTPPQTPPGVSSGNVVDLRNQK